MENNYPEKGTNEYHLKQLKRLRNWLSNARNMTPLIEDEMAAIDWAVGELEKAE